MISKFHDDKNKIKDLNDLDNASVSYDDRNEYRSNSKCSFCSYKNASSKYPASAKAYTGNGKKEPFSAARKCFKNVRKLEEIQYEHVISTYEIILKNTEMMNANLNCQITVIY